MQNSFIISHFQCILFTATHFKLLYNAQQLDAALDLFRRLPSQDITKNIAAVLEIAPDLTEDLLASVDQPLQIKKCPKTSKLYLACDYNRDGDSYRSPWSNEYTPVLVDGIIPNEKTRKLEIAFNEAFDIYRTLYYEGGISSVYLWDLDNGFAGVVLIKKESSKNTGYWDSIHVFEVPDTSRTVRYRLTSTIILHMMTQNDILGQMSLSGNITRQIEQELPVDDSSSHIAHVGRLVEDMEIKMRNILQEVYFGKTKDICNELRSISKLSQQKEGTRLQKEVVEKLSRSAEAQQKA
ncbi:unnamed protein product [Pneumocystis jirovecii]|uniref:F-actin-capping protein subunit beta n=1 Tax=Pneumocystis jirovecii TaxID=42068 RepID=L0P7I8_PNEJI|nr:unnamed protein product [Pneumocystis jirovecii]CCJ31591.1 unnamed protein product [Pneumocystis jirovecii]